MRIRWIWIFMKLFRFFVLGWLFKAFEKNSLDSAFKRATQLGLELRPKVNLNAHLHLRAATSTQFTLSLQDFLTISTFNYLRHIKASHTFLFIELYLISVSSPLMLPCATTSKINKTIPSWRHQPETSTWYGISLGKYYSTLVRKKRIKAVWKESRKHKHESYFIHKSSP